LTLVRVGWAVQRTLTDCKKRVVRHLVRPLGPKPRKSSDRRAKCVSGCIEQLMVVAPLASRVRFDDSQSVGSEQGVQTGSVQREPKNWLTGWPNPSKSALQEAETGGSIHQFLWRRSRAASNAKQELSGKERNRNRSESSQVVQAGFRPGPIAVTVRVNGCYCASARGG
jgi:hypothetical protein